MTGDQLCNRSKALFNQLEIWKTLWDEMAQYAMPRKSQIVTQHTPSTDAQGLRLHDVTAIEGTQTLAAGMMDYSYSGTWFMLEPPEDMADSRPAKDFFANASEVLQRAFAASNHALESHEHMLDRSCFGTAHLHMQETPNAPDGSLFYFKAVNVGKFAVAEDYRGMVNEVHVKLEKTLDQLVAQFGLENLSRELQEAYQNRDHKKCTDKHEIVHIIMPRMERDRAKRDAQNMPIASYYVEKKTQHKISESGYMEMPSFVSRYLRWHDDVYGYAPTFEILPVARQVSFVQSMMDVQAELATFPRILAPASMEAEEINLHPLGVTYWDPTADNGQAPQEWATQGRYDVGMDRIRMMQETIRRAYHVDLFQMLTSFQEQRREKTAFEVSAMLQEKIARISPTFARHNYEINVPLIMRGFAIALRAGVLGAIPDQLYTDTGGVRAPKVSIVNRMAMALKETRVANMSRFFQAITPVFQIQPEVVDNFNMDTIATEIADSFSLPDQIILPEETRDAMRQERQQMQQAEQAAEIAQKGASAAKDARAANLI